MAKEKLNDGMFYEIADRINCVITIIERQIKNTRVIDTQDRWHGLAHGAILMLMALMKEVDKGNAEDPLNLSATDRSCWLFEVINELLIEHPEVIHDAKARRLALASSDNLWKLYQHLGSKDINYEPQPKPKPASKGIRKGAKRPVRKVRK